GSTAILPLFGPTVVGPTRVSWNATRTVSGTADPGDVVTVWTAPAGTTSWVQAGSTKADSNKNWSFPLTFTSDRTWRVTSPTGRSASITTVIAPTIYASSTSVASGRSVRLSGRAIPGQSLTLFQKRSGSTTWPAVKTV